MNKKKHSFLVFSLLFSITVIAQKTNAVTSTPKNIFKLSLGSHYFYDDFSKNIFGFNTSLGYERLFAKKWSWGVNFEGYFNENNVPHLKSLLLYNINLPEREQRLAFSPEIRYYFNEAGNGFYLSNIINIQWARHGLLNFEHDCISCPNQGHIIQSVLTGSIRLTLGYQLFINKKTFLGVALAYELREGFYDNINGYQIAFQIGFGK